jgi:hypothetical protein
LIPFCGNSRLRATSGVRPMQSIRVCSGISDLR